MQNKRSALIASMLVLVALAGCTPTYRDEVSGSTTGADMSKEPVKIGFSGPLTGDMGNIGVNAQAAVQIAVEEVNAAGGIQGAPLQVVFEDDQCSGAKAATAVSKLINVDKVTAVLGSVCSSATLAFTPIAEKAQTPVMSFCSTSPKITASGDYIFRDVPSDLFQADFAAEYLAKMGKKKATILYINNDWGVGLRDAFNAAFAKQGGSVVLIQAYDPSSKDLRAQMTKIKDTDADVVYFAGFTDGTIAGLKQAKELGITIPMFGGDAWDDTKIWAEAGASGDGAMYTVVGAHSSDAFKAAMKAKLNNDEVIYCSNYAYDAVKVFAQAMNKVGTDKTALKDELYKTEYTGGVSSESVSFDKNGDPVTAAYVVKKVMNGKADELKEESK